MVGPLRHALDENPECSDQASQSPALASLPNEDSSLEAGYYVHKKSLGEGGFGKVRLGTHLKTNQKVAVKMMNKAKLGQDLERVRIEIEALKVLQHDNIAKLLQVIETNTEIYLILEYCSGGELFDYLISKKRLTESEVRVIIQDLFQVLMYIHNRGFAHRDLKPENILFDDKHRIKLIDFGLAANSSKNKASLAFLQTCCGSPAYAAPELLRGQTYSGPAVDVWSAGVLLYSLLVGQLPFDDDNINTLYKKIQMGRFVMPQWLSTDVRDLISSMLRVNPTERITVPKVLDHRWIRRAGASSQQLEILKSPPNVLDGEAFRCCQLLFSDLTKEQLLVKIKEFGYITSTYLLLKNNTESVKFIKENNSQNSSVQRKHQFLTNIAPCNNNSPRIAAIKRKLQLDSDAITPVKRARDVDTNVRTPNIPYATPPRARLPVAQQKTRVQAKQNPVLTNLKNSESPKSPVRLSDKVTRRIISPKMHNRENNCENTPKNGSACGTPKKPLVNAIKCQTPALIKSPLRDIHNQISKDVKTPISHIKSTPNKSSSTSKKSLLKRIMASATPAKSHTPRKLTTSTHSNNITMTTFKDPQECINRLVTVLSAKGVSCKQKEYVRKTFVARKLWQGATFLVRKDRKDNHGL